MATYNFMPETTFLKNSTVKEKENLAEAKPPQLPDEFERASTLVSFITAMNPDISAFTLEKLHIEGLLKVVDPKSIVVGLYFEHLGIGFVFFAEFPSKRGSSLG